MAEGPFDQELSREFGATPDQRRLISRLCRIYESRGVLRGTETPPLHEACPNCEECWHGHEERQPGEKQAGIALPWVGSRFADARLAVAAINLPVRESSDPDFGGALSQWWIYSDRQAMRSSKRYKGSDFAYAVGSYLCAIRVANSGEAIPAELPSAEQAASAWEECALLELVKCSPHGGRSEPTEGMWANCPGEYLIDELRVLEPRVLLVVSLGYAAERVRLLCEANGWRRLDGLQTAMLTIDDRRFPVICCSHPAAIGQRWRSSRTALVEYLSATAL